jgi:hypothetical protein
MARLYAKYVGDIPAERYLYTLEHTFSLIWRFVCLSLPFPATMCIGWLRTRVQIWLFGFYFGFLHVSKVIPTRRTEQASSSYFDCSLTDLVFCFGFDERGGQMYRE